MSDNLYTVNDPMDAEYTHEEIQPDDRMIEETVTPVTPAAPVNSAKKAMKMVIYGVGAVGFVGACLGAVYLTMRHHAPPRPMINRNALIGMQAPGAPMPGGLPMPGPRPAGQSGGNPVPGMGAMPYPAPGQPGVQPVSMNPALPSGMDTSGTIRPAPDKEAALNGLMQPATPPIGPSGGAMMPSLPPSQANAPAAPPAAPIAVATPAPVAPVAPVAPAAPAAPAAPVAPAAPAAPVVASVVTTSATPDMPNAHGLEGLPTNMPGATAAVKSGPVATSIEQDAYLKKSLQHCERALHEKAHPHVAHHAGHYGASRTALVRTPPHAVALNGVTNNRALIEVDNGASMIVEVGDLVPDVGRVTSIRPEGVRIGTQFVPNTAQ